MKKSIFTITLFLILGLLQTTAQTQLTSIPTVYITTDNGEFVVDKEVYLSGKITIKSSVPSEEITNVKTEVRGRGNSTWNLAKKPYRLKLDKKASLFGLPAQEKSWVLLANHADKTLMRNALAFKISEILGFEFTPSVKFVDLMFNNVFMGSYMLSDQIEVADFRVPVEKQSDTDTTEPAIAGGYLLEIDGFANSEPVWFTTNQGLKITVKYPKDDEINDEQLAYITNFTQNFENALFSSNFKNPLTGYRAMVDTVSLINWYIACELTGNPDSFWSTYIYKKRSENKFFFGPLWDFDIAFNNDSRLGDAVHKLMRNSAHNPRTWIQRLWQDEWFQQAVERRWIELVNSGLESQLITYINNTETLLQASQQLNFQEWNVLNQRVYLETFLFPTYKGGVDYLKQYINDRIDFLSQNFVTPKPTEPFVAEDYYYHIVNKRTNNAIDVTGESLELNAPLMMWEQTEGDDGQLWRIEPLDNSLFRFINKQSGLAMTADGWAKNLIQTTIDEKKENQQWEIVPLFTGGTYGILNPSSGLSVNNSGGGFDNGNPVIVYDNNMTLEDKLNQHWYLKKVEKMTSGNKLVEQHDFYFYVNSQTLFYKNMPNNSTLRIYDIQGNFVYEKRNILGDGYLDLIKKGIYILSIQTNQDVYNMRVIL